MAAFDDNKSKLKALSSLPYKEQAVAFINAFWTRGLSLKDHPEQLEQIWAAKERCVRLDKKGEKGHELDEFMAHRLFEATEGALTVQEMRNVLTSMDMDFNKHVSMTEFLVYKFRVDWHDLVNAPKDDNEAIQEAQQKVTNAQEQLQVALDAETNAQTQLQASIKAERAAVENEAASVAKQTEAKAAEEEVIAAKEAQEKCVASVVAQEQEHAVLIADLTAKSVDESLSTVKRNTAKAQLAQVQQEDPMPLRKAKIGQEAALRRQTKAVKNAAAQTSAAAAALEAAIVARKGSEAAKVASQQATRDAAHARHNAEEAFQEAQQFLEVTRAQNSGTSAGSLWWMDRELEDAKKYMPKAKAAKIMGFSQSLTASTMGTTIGQSMNMSMAAGA